MPRTAPEAKKDAVRGYGGTITECEPSTTSREAVSPRCMSAPAPISCIPTTIRA
jgi:threonine dehydratase